MLSKVNDYVKLNRMIMKGDRIVIGVSGGADSVCLLHVLHNYYKMKMIDLMVVHINHGIRGQEANMDEAFVRDLCMSLDLPYESFYYDVKRIAIEEGLSEEEAGRNLRYHAFIQVCKKLQYNKIAVAHNKNDNAETVLFHLVRGSGITGLTGIASIRKLEEENSNIDIIRPLLCVEREEIEALLHEQQIPYRVDQSNLTENYSRNKIRNKVIPYLKDQVNDNVIEHITKAAKHLKEIEIYLDQTLEEKFQLLVEDDAANYRISVKELQKENIVIQKGIIRKVLKRLEGRLQDIGAIHVDQVLSLMNKQVGRCIHLPYRMVAVKEYDYVKIFSQTNHGVGQLLGNTINIRLEKPGIYEIPEQFKIFTVERFDYKKNMIIPKNQCTKWFDYDKIVNTVEIRVRKEGDFFQLSSGKNKKIKNYFIDQKIPKEEREQVLLIADGSHIMWILDESSRISEKYKIDENTKSILSINYTNMEEI